MPNQQKLLPPVLLFSDFAGWDTPHENRKHFCAKPGKKGLFHFQYLILQRVNTVKRNELMNFLHKGLVEYFLLCHQNETLFLHHDKRTKKIKKVQSPKVIIKS